MRSFKQFFSAALLVAAAGLAPACATDELDLDVDSDELTVNVFRNVTANTTWVTGNTYVLLTDIFVSNGAT
jgi:hypothetical protein